MFFSQSSNIHEEKVNNPTELRQVPRNNGCGRAVDTTYLGRKKYILSYIRSNICAYFMDI